MRRWRDVGLGGVVAMALVCLLTPAAVSAGPVSGAVVLQGPVPDAPKVRVTIDQYVCGKEKDAEDLIIGKGNGIKNAVVWVTNPPPAPTAEGTPATAMDQKECSFTPRVVVVGAGGRVDFLNSDRLLHNLHSVPKNNAPFNRTQPKGRTIPITFAQPEIIPINCDLHSWMRGWVVVTEHPFYALSDGNGEFSLPALLGGRYTLRIWHERLGTTTREVVVNDQGPTTVRVEMAGR